MAAWLEQTNHNQFDRYTLNTMGLGLVTVDKILLIFLTIHFLTGIGEPILKEL